MNKIMILEWWEQSAELRDKDFSIKALQIKRDTLGQLSRDLLQQSEDVVNEIAKQMDDYHELYYKELNVYRKKKDNQS